MKNLNLSIILLGALLSFGCAHSVHHVHTSDFAPQAPLERGTVVKGYAEQFVILGFASDTHYVDEAYAKIQQACPKGVLTGITTQFSTSLGFFSWTNKILMQGLCLQGRAG
jgi:hypothetical protein